MLNRLILIRIRDNICSSSLNYFQSAYCKYNATETELLLALDNVYSSIDQGSSTLLVSLNLSNEFGTIDHDILLNRLHASFGISVPVLDWFRSYLSPSNKFVRIQSAKSATTKCILRVPQDSVLGPVLFSLYILPIAHIAAAHGLMQQQYADDTQLYVAISHLNRDTALAEEVPGRITYLVLL